MNISPLDPLRLDVSLWSADLANLERDIRRLEPIADSFHLDACDGHYAPTLLFFPDLVARVRQLTAKPLHLHLMATRPMDLQPAFLDAGVDAVTIPVEMGKRVWQVLEHVRGKGKLAGISLELDSDVDLAKPYRSKVDTVVLMGTAMGIKGCGLDDRACDRMAAMRSLVEGYRICVTADGGIRENTVPLLRAAGANAIVPGSLICNADDPAATAAWLRSL